MYDVEKAACEIELPVEILFTEKVSLRESIAAALRDALEAAAVAVETCLPDNLRGWQPDDAVSRAAAAVRALKGEGVTPAAPPPAPPR
jgi:hypothetical protein